MEELFRVLAILFPLATQPAQPPTLAATEYTVALTNVSCFSETELNLARVLYDNPDVQTYVKLHEYNIVANLTAAQSCELVPPTGAVMSKDDISDLVANSDVRAVGLIKWAASNYNVDFARLYIAVVLGSKINEFVTSEVVQQILGGWLNEQDKQ
jgi:hypothetical protein